MELRWSVWAGRMSPKRMQPQAACSLFNVESLEPYKPKGLTPFTQDAAKMLTRNP